MPPLPPRVHCLIPPPSLSLAHSHPCANSSPRQGDLHGHSRKHNVFCYGCERPNQRSFVEMVFPRLLWRNSSIFSFSDCSFRIQRAKESTARVVVHRELGIVNSFTLEATLAGPNFGRYAGTHLTPALLRSVGHALCDTLLDYFDPDPSKREAIADELRMLYPHGFTGGDGDSDGSDGNPEEDCTVTSIDDLEKEMKARTGALKKLAQKARRERHQHARRGRPASQLLFSTRASAAHAAAVAAANATSGRTSSSASASTTKAWLPNGPTPNGPVSSAPAVGAKRATASSGPPISAESSAGPCASWASACCSSSSPSAAPAAAPRRPGGNSASARSHPTAAATAAAPSTGTPRAPTCTQSAPGTHTTHPTSGSASCTTSGSARTVTPRQQRQTSTVNLFLGQISPRRLVSEPCPEP